MPHFSSNVPVDPRGPAYPIVRTPISRPLVAIVTSPNLVGCYTHYWKGRTIPCEGPECPLCMAGKEPILTTAGKTVHIVNKLEIECDGPPCEACQAGMPYRWHAYQSILSSKDHLHCLFECTAQAAEHFTEYRDAHQTIRGCQFEASRLHSKPNGRIIIRTRPADLTGISLPKPPDLVKCLGILWGFTAPSVQLGKIEPEKNTQNVKHRPIPEQKQ